MPRHVLAVAAATIGLLSAGGALGATVSDVTGSVGIAGTVTPRCSIGSLQGDTNIFDLGVLTDTSTGLLRNISPLSKTLVGASCNVQSEITVTATPMLTQDFSGAPPSGFSRSIDYVATATGWTPTPASYNTAAVSNPGAAQSRNTAFAADITVTLSDFSTTGGQTLRLVSDPHYRGDIIVTLTAE